MAKCIFENLTPNQAQVLASWYDGQGEQDAIIWFEENANGDDTPMTKSIETLPNGDVIVYCK